MEIWGNKESMVDIKVKWSRRGEVFYILGFYSDVNASVRMNRLKINQV